MARHAPARNLNGFRHWHLRSFLLKTIVCALALMSIYGGIGLRSCQRIRFTVSVPITLLHFMFAAYAHAQDMSGHVCSDPFRLSHETFFSDIDALGMRSNDYRSDVCRLSRYLIHSKGSVSLLSSRFRCGALVCNLQELVIRLVEARNGIVISIGPWRGFLACSSNLQSLSMNSQIHF